MTVPDTPQPHWTVNGGELVCDDEQGRRSVLSVLGDMDVWTEHGEALLAIVAEQDALATTLTTAQAEIKRLRLAYIEATNPGIDMAEVERRLDPPPSDTPDIPERS